MKQSLIPALLLFRILLSAQTVPVDCQTFPLLIFNDLNKMSRLHRVKIDPVNGTALLEPFPGVAGSAVNAIGYRLKDKMVYGCQGNQLLRIDGTGNAQVVTAISEGWIGGDVTPDSRYYVLAFTDRLLFIDLESGGFEETSVKYSITGDNKTLISTDVAFNPVTGVLYAFDIGLRKLVTIDVHSGLVDKTTYPVIDIEGGLPALFFDSFGNLWGIGSKNGDQFLYQINTFTGQLVGAIPIFYQSAGRLDGCSCPGHFNFQKIASPDTVSHCGTVQYTFVVSNRTGQTQQGVDLEDRMPPGVQIEAIIRNPFGGQVLSGAGTDYLLLQKLNIPEGVDSIVVRVKLDNLPSGAHHNQALLKNIRINAAQPENLLSDNPGTFALTDSTGFFVTDLSASLKPDTLHLCRGEAVSVNASVPGAVRYLWNTGDTSAGISVDAGGDYVVEIQTQCETAFDTFTVREESIFLDLGDNPTISIGDTLYIRPEVTHTSALNEVKWTAVETATIACNSCLETALFPFRRTKYTLQVTDLFGCTTSDDLEVQVERPVYVPNVFKPDAGPANDRFFIQSAHPFPLSYWRIFDRWGNLVFERRNIATNDQSNAWDGTSAGRKLPAGVYVWLAEIAYPDGRREALQGNVTILY